MHRNTILKKILCCTLLLTVASSAWAQYRRSSPVFHAYPFVGFTVSQMEGDELKGFKHWGFTGGVGALLDLSDNGRWALSVETGFTQRGIREASRTATTLYNITGMNLNYVDIPLLVHYTDPYGGMTFGLGLCYSRLVQQPHGTISYNPNFFMPDTSDLTFLRNDISAVASFRFTLWQNLKLDCRLQYSLLPVKKDWQFTEHITSTHTETYINDCYNFSISTRLIWVLGDDQSYSKSKKRKRRR